jgi:hypothetical protein
VLDRAARAEAVAKVAAGGASELTPLLLAPLQVDCTTRSALSYAAQSPEELPAGVILQLIDYGALDLHPWSINKHHPTLHNGTQVRRPCCLLPALALLSCGQSQLSPNA